MPESPFGIYLAGHVETAWTLSHQHTGRIDIQLIENGERNAKTLGERLCGAAFDRVLSSSLSRARQIAALAGFEAVVELEPDLMERDYGRYDGKMTAEIRQVHPDWSLFRDGDPGGESPAAVGARADRVIARLQGVNRRALLFGHAHFIRVVVARWLGLAAAAGRLFSLSTASLSV
jgi:probable phosphoglycerate mutase